MAGPVLKIIFLFNLLHLVFSELAMNALNEDIFDTSTFVTWPNGVVPFYINQDHFDSEQAMTIMRALSLFAFKSCLKFAPTMVPPTDEQHVLMFENPGGTRKCDLMRHGFPREGPHRILLGYDCLESPMLERVVMRALGFPFEHNRAVRDSYISVQLENVDQSAVELFAKDYKLPHELRPLPYDINSVTHFGDRDYSKNGHRTIIFKDHNVKQNRNGLSEMDMRKIELIYGPECRKRDRQEKIELCHQYPANTVNRRKRAVETTREETTRSLRVNPDITPPPQIVVTANRNISKEVSDTLNSLGIALEVQAIVDQVYNLSAKALRNARVKYCNETKEPNLREGVESESSPDILGIIELVAAYARGMVDNAVANLTVFCEESKSIDTYRSGCWGGTDPIHCKPSYKSTKSGAVMHSTQFRPFIIQSTKHHGGKAKPHRDSIWRSRADSNETIAVAHHQAVEVATMKPVRRKREAISSEVRDGGVKDRADSNETIAVAHHQAVEVATVKVRRKREAISSEVRDGGVKDRADSNETIAVAVEVATMKPVRRKREAISSEDRDGGIGVEDSERAATRPVVNKRVEYERARRHDSEDSSASGETRRKRYRSGEESDIVRPKPKRQKEPDSPDADSFIPTSSRPSRKPKRPQKTMTTTVPLSKLNEEFYSQRRWPNGLIPYIIDKDSGNGNYNIADLRNNLDEVNQILKRKTCVEIREIWEREANKYEDYLVIDNSPDYVTGRVGGKQIFGSSELLKGGQHRQFPAMMVMAMLGFYFECARHDRDKYIRVHLRHVRADKLHHFEKIRADATLPLPYDYQSATHPAWQFWRKVGKTGISTVATYKDQDPDGSIMKSLGQNEDLLSEGDLIKINSVYGIQCMTDPNEDEMEEKKENLENIEFPVKVWSEEISRIKRKEKTYKRKHKKNKESFSD